MNGGSVAELEPSRVSVEAVGQKAFGLACLPAAWTKPFFVVSGLSPPTQAALSEAAAKSGTRSDAKLLVRSSGTEESLENRGTLESAQCIATELNTQIAALAALVADKHVGHPVHWVVQELLHVAAKGHLSNERRVAEDKRDWVAEVEASASHGAEYSRIPLRTWRDQRIPAEVELACPYREAYVDHLAKVARWAYERLIRVHFEWVWDGRAVYIVQADACDETAGGENPRALVQIPNKPASDPAKALQLFRPVVADDYKTYRKLANAKLYEDLGYKLGQFYVLNDAAELRALVAEGRCTENLRRDLEILTAIRPLVLRTDGTNIPGELKQMLPRSDELRSVEAAVSWLTTDFRKRVQESQTADGNLLASFDLCLIGHHFVPAAAAAWCHARPDQRRVRIESLWGIPEGLYWYAYDAFDVDTQKSFLKEGEDTQPADMSIKAKTRFKEHFIAPNSEGAWILHRTAAGPDWQRSIRNTEWIEEIAWSSRRIAARAGKPVVVMWFIDVPKEASAHRVLPWYHEDWKHGASPHKAAPRKKFSTTTDFVLQTRADWNLLKEQLAAGQPVARVRVDPREPEIVRDPVFAEQLGALAKKHTLVVELGGGILSHAYYMLSRTGCVVECADLDEYATDDDEVVFHKLVRDYIPQSIVARGERVALLQLEGEALITALRRKLVEEALEVLDARTNDQIAEELADVKEVMLALMLRLEITESHVEAARKKKLKGRGGFDAALMLSKTSIAPSLSMIDATTEISSEMASSSIAGTISKAIEIPRQSDDIHIDKRHDASGSMERQFTAVLPAHAAGFEPQRLTFVLETQAGEQHEMALDVRLDRVGSDLRLRLRLVNTPGQLSFDFGAPTPE